MSVLEDYIQSKMINYARKRGWLVFEIDYSGWPDRLFLSPLGHHIWVEFKTEEGEVVKRQQHRHQQLEDHHAVVIVVRSVEHGRAIIDHHSPD